jgi:hypothetical protein
VQRRRRPLHGRVGHVAQRPRPSTLEQEAAPRPCGCRALIGPVPVGDRHTGARPGNARMRAARSGPLGDMLRYAVVDSLPARELVRPRQLGPGHPGRAGAAAPMGSRTALRPGDSARTATRLRAHADRAWTALVRRRCELVNRPGEVARREACAVGWTSRPRRRGRRGCPHQAHDHRYADGREDRRRSSHGDAVLLSSLWAVWAALQRSCMLGSSRRGVPPPRRGALHQAGKNRSTHCNREIPEAAFSDGDARSAGQALDQRPGHRHRQGHRPRRRKTQTMLVTEHSIASPLPESHDWQRAGSSSLVQHAASEYGPALRER